MKFRKVNLYSDEKDNLSGPFKQQSINNVAVSQYITRGEGGEEKTRDNTVH